MNLKMTRILVCSLLFISLGLIGLSFMLGGNENAVKNIINIYGLNSFSFPIWGIMAFSGFILILSAFLTILSLRYNLSKELAYVFLMVIAVVPLLTLIDPSRYNSEYGGFPVISSGQGLIKNFALIPIAIFLYTKVKISKRVLTLLNYSSVALVLFWIGAMKFFSFEANGIIRLIENSPFMSWMYFLWDVQTTSNLIGLFDISFAILMGFSLYFRWRLPALISILACGSVFFITQTFLFTTPNTFLKSTLFDRFGQFVLKDLWFVSNLIIIIYLNKNWLFLKRLTNNN